MPLQDGIPTTAVDARQNDERRRVSLLVYHRHGVLAAPLEEGQRVVIGRCAPAGVVVEDPSLSRQHAAFTVVDGQIRVEDLSSTNGTLINGQRISAATLAPSDQVTLGAVTVCLHVLGPIDRRLLSLGGHDRFLADLEDELVRARTFRRKVGLIMVRPATRGQAAVGRWCPRLQQRLRAFDRIALFSSDEVEIATPETGREALAALAAALVAEPQEARLVAGVALYPDSATSAEELIQITRQALLRAIPDAPVQLGAMGGAAISAVPTSEHVVDGPIVASTAMGAVWATVALVAPAALPVLICGETGTGKEVVAHAIHEASGRRERPMCCINCGAIPGQLIESALFGHERGAFSGADQRTKGVFEEADGGTVLLDEIGELSAQAQTALLRVLENKRISRVGSPREIPVDVRVLAATHRDLEEMCEAGTFRQDLLYRLNAMTLRVPPLRERMEELVPLVRQFIQQANRDNGCQVTRIDPEALALLRRYPWPGNVRELRNVIERAVVLLRDGAITVNELSERVRTYSGAAPLQAALAQATPAPLVSPRPVVPAPAVSAATTRSRPPSQETGRVLEAPPSADGLKEHLRHFETLLLVDALERCGWNKAHAARRLDMPLRTLFHKIASYGISDTDGAALQPLREQLTRTDPCAATGRPELRPNLQVCEARLLREALEAAGGDQARAARALQLSPHTLASRLRALGLDR